MWMNILTPTRIYVREVMQILSEYNVHGLAHITGGGFMNLARITDYGITIHNLPEPPMIFKKIQELGKVSLEEMYRTFNMGIGFCIIASAEDSKSMIEQYGAKYGLLDIGEVVSEPEVKVIRKDVEIKLGQSM
jgi:phosphoribosylformylglycinamidine cyclo-ligase